MSVQQIGLTKRLRPACWCIKSMSEPLAAGRRARFLGGFVFGALDDMVGVDGDLRGDLVCPLPDGVLVGDGNMSTKCHNRVVKELWEMDG